MTRMSQYKRCVKSQHDGQVFGRYDPQHVKPGMTYSRLRHLFKLPVVHAKEVYDGSVSEKDSARSDKVDAVPKDSGIECTEKHVQEKEMSMSVKRSACTVRHEEVLEYIRNETGRDRLHDLFHGDAKDGVLAPEMFLILTGTGQATFTGLFFAGYLGAVRAKERFIKNHQGSAFPAKFFGLRAYYDAILIGAMGFGLKWAVKLGFFAGSFLCVSQSVAVYRNKTSFVEYSLGGAVTASILKINMGLRGMFAGAVIGGTLGTVAGLLIWGVANACGQTQDQLHIKRIHEVLLERKRNSIMRKLEEERDIAFVPPKEPH